MTINSYLYTSFLYLNLEGLETNLGKYLQALTDSRAAIASLDNWPIELVKHYKIESDLYIAQNDLYQALASIDKGLKLCDINGMSMQDPVTSGWAGEV